METERMTNVLDGVIGEYEQKISELEALIAEQKTQAYMHSKTYLELLEEIVEDLEEQGLTKEEMVLYYNKKLWSQKK